MSTGQIGSIDFDNLECVENAVFCQNRMGASRRCRNRLRGATKKPVAHRHFHKYNTERVCPTHGIILCVTYRQIARGPRTQPGTELRGVEAATRDDIRALYVMFAGALAPHKGVNVLLEAWSGPRNRPPLVLAGIGRFDTPSSFPHGVIVAEDVAREEVLRAWGPLPCNGISLAEALRPWRRRRREP